MSKIQGEGDYESARKYNDKTRSDVDKMDEDEVAKAARVAETPAEAAANTRGKQKSKAGQQDNRDAEAFRRMAEMNNADDKTTK